MDVTTKLDILKEKYNRLKLIDDIMQSRDRVEDEKRRRVLRIIDLKILILMTRSREG